MFAEVDYTGTGARLLPPANPPVSNTHKAVRAAVVEYQISSFVAYAFDIQIFRQIKENTEGSNPGLGYRHIEKFRFVPEGDKARVLCARLDKNGKPELKLGKYWRPARSYLKTLHIPRNPNRELVYGTGLANCRKHQQNWWDSNGKFFDFLKLPSELRGDIYTFAIGPYVEPFPSSRCRVRQLAPTKYRVNHQLLSVCHQIHNEMKSQVYNLTPFFINAPGVLSRFLHPRPNGHTVEHVAKLHIKLSLEDHLDLFGVHLLDKSTLKDYKWRPAHRQALLALSKMPLKELKLDIALHATLQENHEEPLEDAEYDICQKKFVDVVLHFAWPYLKGYPVELTGHVGKAQKVAFEAKAAHMHKMKKLGFAGWEDEEDQLDGGVRLDGKPVESVDLAHSPVFTRPTTPEKLQPLQVDLPMLCECKPHCWVKWTEEDEPEEEK